MRRGERGQCLKEGEVGALRVTCRAGVVGAYKGVIINSWLLASKSAVANLIHMRYLP